MLNISQNSVAGHIDKSHYKSFTRLSQRRQSRSLPNVIFAILLIAVACMFLPWTQNIRSKGYVTTLNPFDKPQNIQSLIGGKLEQWFVREGDLVQAGDTIAIISESKEEYLDDQLAFNTETQRMAKESSVSAYLEKIKTLKEQSILLDQNQQIKLNQLEIKNQQIDLKINSAVFDLEAAEIYTQNAKKQFDRMSIMFEKNIKSLTDYEQKKLSYQESLAKKNSISNKLEALANEKNNLKQETEIIKTEFKQKKTKINGDIQSIESQRLGAVGESSKLQSKLNQLATRAEAYVIRAPLDGRVTKVIKNGIGQYVKAQESIATIIPIDYKKAVELYIKPNDMPLIQQGKKVRLQFDGWPAVVFSGWPENSFGTFGGLVYAIDNDISSNGKYRILVVENDSEKSWPDLIRIGSGVQGLLLLNDVKVYYELWRQLNGFPPDFYTPSNHEQLKNKAPIRKFK